MKGHNSAFPTGYQTGMSLRMHIAIQVLQTLMNQPTEKLENEMDGDLERATQAEDPKDILLFRDALVKQAFRYADSMLEEDGAA
jgi:hypothetical protein